MGARERLRAVRNGRKNVGGTERLVRGTLGPALVLAGLAGVGGVVTPASGTGGLVVGVVLVLAGLRMTQSAVTQRCYANAILGRDSCASPRTTDGSAVD